MESVKFVDITPENATIQTFFCIKNTSNPGFKKKHQWFNNSYNDGLRMKILKGDNERAIGYIEYLPAEYAWRPVFAPGYMYIHCMTIHATRDKNIGFGSKLVGICLDDARKQKMSGVCVMTSKGSWVTDKRLFVKNGFTEVDKRGRFELMVNKFDKSAQDPELIDWTINHQMYQGWHLLYADQCPWNEKSMLEIKKVADEYEIKLNVKKINSISEAKSSPSGFGVFSLMYNGELLEDHYISKTRFRNILEKELNR
jgi:hypothetical protein